MGHQVNIKCKLISVVKPIIKIQNDKYLMLDPKPSDLTIIRIIKVRTGYRSIDIRRIMVSK